MASESYAESKMNSGKRMAYGVGIGVAIGTAIGALTDDMGLWLALGTALGAAAPSLPDLLSNVRTKRSQKR